MLGVFLLLSLLSVAFGGKLSEAENLERSQTCGRVVQQKVLGGTNVTAKEAPWAVVVECEQGEKQWERFYSSGSVISSRHVLASADAVFWYHRLGFQYIYDDSIVNMTLCKNGIIEIPSHVVAKLSVRTCLRQDECYRKSTKLQPKRAVYIGSCEPKKEPFGVVVMEMETDFAMDRGATPLCVSNTIEAKVGDEVEQYGFTFVGRSLSVPEDAKVIKDKITVKNCGNWKNHHLPSLLHTHSVCFEKMKCTGVRPSVSVKKVEDRMTAVSVFYYEFCHGVSDEDTSAQVSVEAIFSELCEFFGICEPKVPTLPPPTPEPTSEPTSPAPTLPPTSRPVVQPSPPPKDNGNSEQQNQNPEKEDGSEENKEDGGDNSNSENNSEHAAEDTDGPAEDGAHGAKLLELIVILTVFWYLH